MNSIVVMALICLAGSDTDCAEFQFRKNTPVTMEQCVAELPLAMAHIGVGLRPELRVKSARCVNLDDIPT